MAFDPSTARVFDPSTATAQAPAPAPAAAPQAGPAGSGDPGQDESPQGLVKSAGDMLFTALHGAADTATFGLADKASAGLAHMISPLTGKPMSYDEAYAKIQANNSARSGRNPVSAAVGDVAGVALGAGKLAQGAKMIPGVGRLLEAAQPLERSPVSNVLKSAAVGAAGAGGYSAADDVIRNGDVNPDNVLTNAAVGAVVGPVVSKIGTAIARGVQSSSTKAMTLLASKLEEDPATLQRAYDNFNAATGRVPTMAELVQMKSQGELKALAAKNPIVQGAFNDAADAADAQRPAALSQNIENAGGPAQDVTTLARARTDRMTAAMAPIRRSPVGIDTNDVGLLTDRRTQTALRRAKDPELRTRVAQAIDEVEQGGQSDLLDLNDIDSLRQSLRSEQANLANTQSGFGNSVAARSYGNHIDNVTALGTSAEPAYQDALNQFASDSHYLRGFKHGLSGKSIGEATDAKLQAALEHPEGIAGHQAGIVSRTSDAAAASPQGASQTAEQLAAGTGDSAPLRQAVGQQGFTDIQRAADAEARGSRSLSNLSGRVNPADEGLSGKQVAQAAGGVVSHSPAAIIYHAARVVPSFGKLPDAVQRQVARYLTTPSMTQQGINLLRRAGAKDDEIRKLAVALSANAGLNTAATLGQ